jgi:molecular chaperone DnaJ
MNRDLYQILDITKEEEKLPQAQFDEILKKRYREKALLYHPDRQQEKTEKEKQEAEEKFKKLAEAKEILSDPNKRRQYDLTGSNSGFNFSHFHDDDLEEFLRNFMSGGGFSGMAGNNKPRYFKGNDISFKVQLNIEDVINGCEKKYKYKVNTPCPSCNGGEKVICSSCNGSGVLISRVQRGSFVMQQSSVCPHCQGKGFAIKNNCSVCHGTGLKEVEESISVNFPKGFTVGNSLVVPGGGHHLPKSIEGIPGDLNIIITNINSGEWQIQNYDCFLFKEVPILDIILGSDIEIIGIRKEKLKVSIPRNTANEAHFRLAGKGLPIANSKKNGDAYIIIKYKFPTQIID